MLRRGEAEIDDVGLVGHSSSMNSTKDRVTLVGCAGHSQNVVLK